jgi:uncharacterized protein YraI
MVFGFPGLCRSGTLRPLVCCLLIAPTIFLARPAARVDALALGGGSYRITASVFGVPADGLVGNQTSSGHTLAPNDRLVALPACTESSCPWVPAGTGTDGQWGPQTTCAEADGLCWVQITSLDTGACTVAPVLDRGPLFVEDNWWAPSGDRTYPLKQGLPAAEYTRDGGDVGFGPGFSDRGYDIQHVYDYAAAIDIAAGTWVDLGLDPDQGVAGVEVTLLWQAGTNHQDACGGYGNASTTDRLNLRAGPSTGDDVLTVMDTGDRVGITGGEQSGFYPVVYDGQTGWASTDYVRPDGSDGPGAAIGIVTERVNLRAGPSTADDVIDQMPAGNLVVLTGQEQNGFLSVSYHGEDGWAFADYLDTGNGFSESGGDGSGGSRTPAVTTDDLNFRTGPSTADDVILVIPAGASVVLTGQQQNGFYSAGYQGMDGWLSGDYLDIQSRTTLTVLEDLNLRTGPSTDDDVILVMAAGDQVTIRGPEQNGFVPVTYYGTNGWAYSQYLG